MKTVLKAAALCCGLLLSGALAKEILPESGPIGAMAQRLLLIDAARFGNRIVAVGDRGYVIYSDDQGETWSRAKAPQGPLLTAVTYVDAKSGWAVGHDAIVLATADGGSTWAQQFSAPAERRPLLDVMFLDAIRGIAVGAYGAYYETVDGGKSWNPRKIVDEDRHLNGLVRTADGKLVILGESGTILVSGDEGKTWSAVPSPYKGSLFGGVAANDGAIVAYGLRGRIFRSTDAGRTWKQVDNPSTATLMGSTTLPDGAIVLVGAGGTVLLSRDQGQSFVKADSGGTRALAGATLGTANTLLLLGEGGVRPIPLPSGPNR